MDKAGAYAIQGLASRFVPGVEGSYSNVVGLPVALSRMLPRRLAVELTAGRNNRAGVFFGVRHAGAIARPVSGYLTHRFRPSPV